MGKQGQQNKHILCTIAHLDRSNKKKNQINGVNPNRPDYKRIMRRGFGINEALDSILTNYFLDLFE